MHTAHLPFIIITKLTITNTEQVHCGKCSGLYHLALKAFDWLTEIQIVSLT